MQRLLSLLAALFICAGIGLAQIKPAAGIRQNTPNVHAFINARIFVAPGRVIGKGTLVIRDGTVSAVKRAFPDHSIPGLSTRIRISECPKSLNPRRARSNSP